MGWVLRRNKFVTLRQISEDDCRHRFCSLNVDSILGTFEKLRNATISFVMSVCPHGTTRLPLDGFGWNLIFEKFWESVGIIQNSLKSDKNNRYFTWRRFYIFDHISLNSPLLRMRNVLDKLVEKVKPPISCWVNFFFVRKSHRLWDNVGKCSGDSGATNDVTIWRIRVACWISRLYGHMPKHTPTRSDIHMHARTRKHAHTDQYVILIVFPQQQWFRERASMLRYTYIACLVIHFLYNFTYLISLDGNLLLIQTDWKWKTSFSLYQ
jgi:hypothetical protein